ncbi:MAG: hypothetical protein JWP88_1127 [Flaviaesturariibacter sp.]|nr:hypothetical protein [Flaviaesturariibacter sp.]
MIVAFYKEMSTQPKPSLSLTEQLQELEDLYANMLIANESVRALSRIWRNIKELRQQLDLPVYEASKSGKQ